MDKPKFLGHPADDHGLKLGWPNSFLVAIIIFTNNWNIFVSYASAFRRRRHYVFRLSVRPSVRPSEAWNALFWPVHGSVGPPNQPWPFYGMSVRLSVRQDRFPGICQRMHGGNGLKFCMLMYLDHLQNWLVYGHGLLIFSCDQAALWMVHSVSLCVCLSVTPFSLCSHHCIIMKFSGVITNDESDVHAKGQGQGSKVKVTGQHQT